MIAYGCKFKGDSDGVSGSTGIPETKDVETDKLIGSYGVESLDLYGCRNVRNNCGVSLKQLALEGCSRDDFSIIGLSAGNLQTIIGGYAFAKGDWEQVGVQPIPCGKLQQNVISGSHSDIGRDSELINADSIDVV